MKKPTLIAVFVTTAAILCAAHQVAPDETEQPTGPITESLAKYHIGLTKESLIQALQNDNSNVRWLAAVELASEGARDAIPAITTAMRNEPKLDARLNIAYALAQLGELSGNAIVRSTCNNQSESDALRVRAIRYMTNLKSGDCIDAAFELIEARSPATPEVLSLMPRFRDTSPKQHSQLSRLAESSLLSSDPVVRRTAAQVLAKLKDISAIPSLTEAMNGEQDDSVRGQMQATIAALQALK